MGSVLGRLACCPIQCQYVLRSGDFVSFLDWDDGYWISIEKTMKLWEQTCPTAAEHKGKIIFFFKRHPPCIYFACVQCWPQVCFLIRENWPLKQTKVFRHFPWKSPRFSERGNLAEAFMQCTFSFDSLVHFCFWFGWLLGRPPKHWNRLLVVQLCWCILADLLAMWDPHILCDSEIEERLQKLCSGALSPEVFFALMIGQQATRNAEQAFWLCTFVDAY